MQALVREQLRRRLPPKATAMDIEQAALRLSREIFGPVIGQELTAEAKEVTTCGCCGQCGARVHLVDRARTRRLTGVLGESEYERPYLYCDHCRQGYVPADQVLGIGAGAWLPSLQQASTRLGIESSYERAASALAEAIYLPIPEEDVCHATETIGVVAEDEQQAWIAKAQAGQEQPGPAETDTLVVGVDG